jgi:hypothetical protein
VKARKGAWTAAQRPRKDRLAWEVFQAAVEGRTVGCPEHGIQIADAGVPRCGCLLKGPEA